MNSYQSSKKKLVIVLSRFPYPLEKGDKLRAYYQIKDLSKFFDIFLICITDKEINNTDYNKINTYCKEMKFVKINLFNRLFSILKACFTGLPFQIAYFTTYTGKKNIANYLKEIKPDVIFCQLVRAAEYVKNYHDCNKVIDIMDALSVGMLQRAEKSNFVMNIIYNEESKRLKKYENRIINYFENGVIISNKDKEVFNPVFNNKIKVIPNGITERFFESNNEIKNIDILFTGNMQYLPNVKTVDFINDKIVPKFKDKIFAYVGASPVKRIQNLASNKAIVTGWVDDILPYYQRSKIFIAPMFIGTGMQNKVLEAMACGIPCVLSPLVANAIGVEHEKQTYIADNENDLIHYIKLLLESEELAKKLGNAGREFVKDNFNWQNLNLELKDLLI